MKTLSWLERSALKLARVKVKRVKWNVGVHFSKLKIDNKKSICIPLSKRNKILHETDSCPGMATCNYSLVVNDYAEQI